MTWTDPEFRIPCKGRLDWLIPALTLADLKGVENSKWRNEWSLVSQFASFLYQGQLAMYYDGAIECGLLPKGAALPIIIAHEKPPAGEEATYDCDVATWQMPLEDYDAGRRLYRGLMRKYVECMAADWWPGIAPSRLETPLPSWAAGKRDDDDNNEDPFGGSNV